MTVTATRTGTDFTLLRIAIACVAAAIIAGITPMRSYAAGDPLPDKLRLHLELRYSSVTFLETSVPTATFEPLLLPRERVHDPWLAYDKALHFGISFMITVSGQYALVNKLSMSERGALPVSSGVALSVGLGKELYDFYYGPRRFFSTRDMVANFAGVLLAGAFILL